MAQSGQIRGKVAETQLIDILDQMSGTKPAQSKIKFQRRTMGDSDDDDDLYDKL
jgi:programmed cell death protein 5